MTTKLIADHREMNTKLNTAMKEALGRNNELSVELQREKVKMTYIFAQRSYIIRLPLICLSVCLCHVSKLRTVLRIFLIFCTKAEHIILRKQTSLILKNILVSKKREKNPHCKRFVRSFGFFSKTVFSQFFVFMQSLPALPVARLQTSRLCFDIFQ